MTSVPVRAASSASPLWSPALSPTLSAGSKSPDSLSDAASAWLLEDDSIEMQSQSVSNQKLDLESQMILHRAQLREEGEARARRLPARLRRATRVDSVVAQTQRGMVVAYRAAKDNCGCDFFCSVLLGAVMTSGVSLLGLAIVARAGAPAEDSAGNGGQSALNASLVGASMLAASTTIATRLRSV